MSVSSSAELGVLHKHPFCNGGKCYVNVIAAGARARLLSLLDLGSAFVNVLEHLSLSERLVVATASRDLRDFIYDHFELWPNISAEGAVAQIKEEEQGTDTSTFASTLAWAGDRGLVRRLRAFINPNDSSSGTISGDAWIKNSFSCLSRCLPKLSNALVSLNVTLTVGQYSQCPASGASFVTDIITVAPTSLRQLTLRVPNLHFPAAGSRLTALTALCLHSPDASGAAAGVTLHSDSLPTGLLHLSISSSGSAALPEALRRVAALKGLAIDWAMDSVDAPIFPDFSLLQDSLHGTPRPSAAEQSEERKRIWNTTALTHLSLGYFQAAALPKALPPTLKSLELQWNLTTCEPACRKAGFDVDAFHGSFSSLAPLTALTHLNLNKALGAWGLPPAVLHLTQLESLGVAGGDAATSAAWTSSCLAQQLAAFRRLRSLDIEILDAAAGWAQLVNLTNIEKLRLGRGGQPEAYVHQEVKNLIGQGLINLLPAMPMLKEVHTEGMLLPATAACAPWARLAGFDSPVLKKQAWEAMETLHGRRVALQRWYTWPFWPANEGMAPWDEVEIR